MALSVSQILSDTISALKARFWGLVGMWLVFFAIMMGMLLAFTMFVGGGLLAMAGSMENPDAMGAGLGGGMIALMIVFYIAYLLLACAQYAALAALASPLEDSDFGGAFSAGMRSSPTLLVAMVLFLIAYFVAALAFGLLAALLSALGTLGAVISVLLIVGIVLYLACRVGVVFAVVPVEGMRNPFAAIARSWALTRGNALPIFLALLVFVVVMVVAITILVAPLLGSFSEMAGGTSAPPIGAMAFLLVGGMVLSVVLALAYSAFLAALHARLAGGTGEQLVETFE